MSIARPAVPANQVRVDFIGLCALDRRDGVVRLLDTRGDGTRHWPTLYVPNHAELSGTPDIIVLPPSADRSGAVWILEDCTVRIVGSRLTPVTIDDTPIVIPENPTPDEARSTRMLMDLNTLYGTPLNRSAVAPVAATVALETGRVRAIPGDPTRRYQFTDSVSGVEVFPVPRPLAASFEWSLDVSAGGTVTLEIARSGATQQLTVGGGNALVVANACACEGESDYLKHTHLLAGLTSTKRLTVAVGPFEEEYPHDVRCGCARYL